MLRAHGTDTPREIWHFGNPGEIFYDSLVKFLRLRYRLIPYIYSVSGMVTQDDYTLVRALPFDFRCDARTYDIDDQYMFGPALLISPVTKPMYYESESTLITGVSKSRLVYLPDDADWYDFWTGKYYSGGQTIITDAPLDIIPIFVRSGSILPIGPDINYTDEKPDAPLDLYVYPGRSGSFTLYDDEGDNYNYEQGDFAKIHIFWNDKTRQITFYERHGSYSGMPDSRDFRIVMGNSPFNVLSSEISSLRTVRYEGQEITIKL